jgi:Ca2+:H+ antiporter
MTSTRARYAHPFASTLRENRLLWLLVLVPLPLIGHAAAPESETLVFALSVAAIVPLAALLSLATEQVAARTGDALGGLLNATLGNLTELVIAVTALRAGEYVLVKASIAGVIVTNTLFMMGAAFFLGGLKHHVQEFNQANARMHLSLLLLAAFALLIPSAIGQSQAREIIQPLSVGTSILLLAAYGLGLVFSLGTHRAYFGDAAHERDEDTGVWPVAVALGVLAVTTLLVALVSEVFVESVQGASRQLGLSPAFVGFVVVALVGGAAEMTSAFSAAMKDRLDLSVAIAFGSSTQIALFVAPVLVLLSYVIGPEPMTLEFWPWAVVMMFIALATASLLTAGGRSAWFLGVLMLMVYAIFALTLYLLPASV